MKNTVDVVIPSWNTRELLRQCLESLGAGTALPGRVVVVDNASRDGTQEMVTERFPDAELLRNQENLGFAAAANRGVRHCEAPYVLLLNSDAQLEPGTLDELVDAIDQRSDRAIVGAQILAQDGSFQASHAPFPTLGGELLILSGVGRLLYGSWYPSRAPRTDGATLSVDYVSGACMLIRRSAFDAVGGFDESYFLYAEEVDLCRRLDRAGWEVAHAAAARVRHVGGASSGGAQREAALYRGRVMYFRKHRGPLSTATLKVTILASTAIKRTLHGALRLLSAGKRGREVAELSAVRAALRGI